MRKLDRKNIKDILALTPMQEGMLFHYLKNPRDGKHFEQLVIEISGNLDRRRFEKAWNHVIAANEMLRTVFRWEGLNNPAQLVLKEHRIEPGYFDLSGEKGKKKNTLIEKIKTDAGDRGFDLQEVPFRVSLCKTEEKKYGIIIDNHHILYDGWSNGIIIKEFFDAYNEFSLGRVPVTPRKTGYREFIKWSRDRDRRKEDEFWKEYLSGFRGKDEGVLTRKQDVCRTAAFPFEFPAETVTKLDGFTKKNKISLPVLLYTAWGIVLQKYHNAEDVLFDATVSGRSAKVKGIENMVGLFINTLPVRINRRPGETAMDLLVRIKEVQRKWEEFENTSALTLREHRDGCHNPLRFDSVVVVENYPLDAAGIQNNSTFSIDSFSNTGKTGYDLTLLITVSGPVKVDLSYNVDLFAPRGAALVVRHFISILDELVTSPDKPVPEIDILPAEEIEEITNRLKRAPESGPGIEPEFTAPRDMIEERLVAIWSDVLSGHRRTETIGIDDNFFDFGGHSLKASLLAARMHREFQVKISLAEVFRRPTVREMAEYIKRRNAKTFVPINPLEKRDSYPLSSAQKRLYVLQQMDLSSSVHNGSLLLEIRGELNIDRLTGSFRKLMERHESLRTSFPCIDGEPVQRVWDNVSFAMEQYRPTGEPGARNDVNDVIGRFKRAFDLAEAPLFRVGLIVVEANKHILMVDIHHIISDGVSRDILMKEFTSLYSGETLPPLKLQYRDFSQWKNRRLRSGELKEQEAFWLEQFPGEPPDPDLPYDFPRPSVQSFEGDRVRFHLGEELRVKLKGFTRGTGTTLFMVLLSVYKILLSRYGRRDDITVGSPVSGRTHADLENIFGLLIDTVVLRSFPSGEKTFGAYLEEVKEITLRANENQDYPFRELAARVTAENDLTRNPLFVVMLNVLKPDVSTMEWDGLKIKPFNFDFKVSWVDLTVEVTETRENIVVEMEYCTALFKRDTVELLGKDFVRILEQVLDEPGIRLSEIRLVKEAVQEKLRETIRTRNKELSAEFSF